MLLQHHPYREHRSQRRNSISGPNNVGGRTRALMWDPNDANATKLWAGATSGGIWFNNDITDANSSWVNVDDFLSSLAISDISYDPNNTTTFYAGTGEGYIAGNGGGGVAGAGLYKSTDAGSNWTLLSSTTGPDFRYITKVLVSPSSSAVLISTRESINEGGSGGIFRSTDGGDTWTEVIDGRGADLELASNGDIYASTGIGSGSGQVWRSTDDGVNWTEVTPPGGSPLWIELAVAPSQSSETSSTRIYALAQDAGTRTSVTWFQRSDDGGSTWTDLDIPNNRNQDCTESASDFTRGQAFYDLIVKVQPSNADVVTIGGIDIYRSTTAGTNMELISYWTGACDDFVHADQHEAAYRPGFPNEAVFGHDGGVSYSADVGNPSADPAFDTRNNNYSVTQFYAMAARNEAGSNNMLAGSQDNGTQRLSEGNGSTANQAVGGDGAFCHIDQTDGSFQIASVQFNSVFHSSNGGVSFTRLTNQDQSHGFINPTDLDNQSHILYTNGAGNEYMVIRDINSNSPSAAEFISVNVGTISHINADSEVDNRLYIGSRQGDIFRIDDAHTTSPTVTEITGNITSPGNVSSVSIGATEDQLLATFSNFGVTSVWLTVDGGTTWTNKDEAAHGLPDIPVRWSLFNPNNSNEVLLATELGIWSTTDILADNPGWEPTSTNLANVRCDMLQYREADGNVFVATFGRGIFSTDAFSSTQDTTPPNIVSLTPTDGSTELFTDVNLEVAFNESIVLGTGNVSILRTSDDSVFEQIDASSSALSASGARLIINP
ncbi:MAG: Ig-like domain-containing protein, partial [Bacteroidota bacterium]